MSLPKVVLCMIVKNEAHVIERCLSSMLPVIDTWCIVDTGSTDGTQEKIKNFFNQLGIEGKLYERPWKNFAHNRSEALELARPMGDYSWMIDADEILEFDANFDPDKFKSELTCDLYDVFAFYGGIRYHRPQLTSNRLKFYYKFILHECAACDQEIKTRAFAKGVTNRPIQDGARSKNPTKYADDAKLFEDAFAKGGLTEEETYRYQFYMAQCYRDAQMWEKSLAAYQKRAEMGGWAEEVFYSLYQVAKLKHHLKYPIDECIRDYFKAFQTAPYRAESLYDAVNLCIENARFHQAYSFTKEAVRLPLPLGALFVHEPIYTWAMLYKHSIASYWVGDYKSCVLASQQLLKDGKLPESEKSRVENNLKIALDRLVTN